MLSDVWTSLVNEVSATKRHYKELEATLTTTNNCLNDGISALDSRVDKWEDKFCILHNIVEDVRCRASEQRGMCLRTFRTLA